MDRSGAEQQPQRAPKTSALSLLGLSNHQPSNEASALELNESDVVWSFNNYVAIEEESTSPTPSSLSSTASASESPTFYNQDRKFGGERYGLSAVLGLAEENPPLVRRKASPSIGMGMAGMRTMIPRSRKGSPSRGGDGGSFGSGGGRFNMSAPVNIPVWGKMRRFEEEEEGSEDGVDGDKEMLPPHEVVAARSQMTFSVFEGAGRTLKGRDLRRMRNAVFQQTGFLG